MSRECLQRHRIVRCDGIQCVPVDRGVSEHLETDRCHDQAVRRALCNGLSDAILDLLPRWIRRRQFDIDFRRPEREVMMCVIDAWDYCGAV